VALISHTLWQRDFGGGQDVLGRSVRINGKPATVIGVMPPGFAFPGTGEIWIPLYSEFPPVPRSDPRINGNQVSVIGLLKPGVLFEAATAEFTGIAAKLAQAFPDTNKKFDHAQVLPLIRAFVPPNVQGLLWTVRARVKPIRHLNLDIIVMMAKIANIMKTGPAAIDPLLSDLPSVDASTVKNQFREVAARAAETAVAISRYGRPQWVIMPAAEFVRLEKSRRAPLDALSGQFDDLVSRMQTSKAKKAARSLFSASPSALGKAAVKAAKAHGR
jgi:prevent-host-death family protein